MWSISSLLLGLWISRRCSWKSFVIPYFRQGLSLFLWNRFPWPFAWCWGSRMVGLLAGGNRMEVCAWGCPGNDNVLLKNSHPTWVPSNGGGPFFPPSTGVVSKQNQPLAFPPLPSHSWVGLVSFSALTEVLTSSRAHCTKNNLQPSASWENLCFLLLQTTSP